MRMCGPAGFSPRSARSGLSIPSKSRPGRGGRGARSGGAACASSVLGAAGVGSGGVGLLTGDRGPDAQAGRHRETTTSTRRMRASFTSRDARRSCVPGGSLSASGRLTQARNSGTVRAIRRTRFARIALLLAPLALLGCGTDVPPLRATPPAPPGGDEPNFQINARTWLMAGDGLTPRDATWNVTLSWVGSPDGAPRVVDL